MLFSVLIPLYNAEKYIAECIDSVLAQNFDDYEIVIVDDGSTDNGGKIIDRYQEMHSRKIRVIHKENTGVLLTRRRLMQEAKGEYLLWADSDDVIKPNLMSDLYSEICKNNPDMIIYNYEDYDNPDKVIHSLLLPDRTIIENEGKHDVLTKMILGRDLNELWTKCIKKQLVDLHADYTPYKNVSNGDDLFCLFPIMDATNRIEFLDHPYYRYRKVPSSITHSFTYRIYYSLRPVYERAYHYIKKWNFSVTERNSVKDIFATRTIDCVVSCANSTQTDCDAFCAFADDVLKDEKRTSVFSDGARQLSSKNYQRFYELLIKQDYQKLYRSILKTTKLSRLKSKLIR